MSGIGKYLVAGAAEAIENGRGGEVIGVLERAMYENPSDASAIYLMGVVMMQGETPGLAYQLFKRCTEIEPTVATHWNSLGRACQYLQRYDEAWACLETAHKLAPDDPVIVNNRGLCLLNQGRPDEALALFERAADASPELEPLIEENVGTAHLALGNWRQGWIGYERALEGQHRTDKKYGPNARRWPGLPKPANIGGVSYEDFGFGSASGPPIEPARTLIVHGEQGIGDEVLFASMIPDLIASDPAREIIIDCRHGLAGLFERSFPSARVYATRSDEIPHWYDPGKPYDVVAVGSLGQYFRNSEAAFPGTPYLKPCPMRHFENKCLFRAGKRAPVIGVAWTGGKHNTGEREKSLPLDDLLPLFRALPGAQFVSLEYKDRGQQIEAFAREHSIHLAHLPWKTVTSDYDDTAALVAACDAVVSCMTSVAHLASALGVQTHMMLPDQPQPSWRYHGRDKHIPWYSCLKLHRKAGRPWHEVAADIGAELAADFKMSEVA